MNSNPTASSNSQAQVNLTSQPSSTDMNYNDYHITPVVAVAGVLTVVVVAVAGTLVAVTLMCSAKFVRNLGIMLLSVITDFMRTMFRLLLKV